MKHKYITYEADCGPTYTHPDGYDLWTSRERGVKAGTLRRIDGDIYCASWKTYGLFGWLTGPEITWLPCPKLKGAQGDTGAPGMTGPQGLQGERGCLGSSELEYIQDLVRLLIKQSEEDKAATKSKK